MDGTGIVRTSALAWRIILPLWQSKHSLAQRTVSRAMWGQQKRAESNLLVAFPPGWPILCNDENICRRRGIGTSGLGLPVDRSQRREEPSYMTYCIFNTVDVNIVEMSGQALCNLARAEKSTPGGGGLSWSRGGSAAAIVSGFGGVGRDSASATGFSMPGM